jgi:ribose transport system substrate-binding protein
MKPLSILSGLLMTGLTLALFGCGDAPKPKTDQANQEKPNKEKPNKEKVKVGFVTNNPLEFWLIVEQGAREAEKETGVELFFKRPANGTAAEQREIIDTLLAQGVKAISISVKDPENQTPYLNQVAQEVPLLAIDNDADKSKRRCYIGTDNVKAGRAVGKLIKEAMPEGGVIALFVGQIEPINARERVQGVLEELGIQDMESKDGKYRLHRKEPYTDDAKRPQAKENASAVLAQLKDKKNVCLVGLWAYNPPAILSAVKDVQQEGKVTIVGFDEDLETLQGIDAGYIYGTVVQNPFEFGRRSVEVMAALARGEKITLPADGKEYVPERIVTKEGGKDRLKASEFRKVVEKQLPK